MRVLGRVGFIMRLRHRGIRLLPKNEAKASMKEQWIQLRQKVNTAKRWLIRNWSILRNWLMKETESVKRWKLSLRNKGRRRGAVCLKEENRPYLLIEDKRETQFSLKMLRLFITIMKSLLTTISMASKIETLIQESSKLITKANIWRHQREY